MEGKGMRSVVIVEMSVILIIMLPLVMVAALVIGQPIPIAPIAYGEAWYWDKRYAQESAPFDWYQNYRALAPLFHLYVPHPNQRILVIGCGNSAFSEEMVNDGYEDVVNVDISSVVIEAMQAKYPNNQHLKYIQMDVRDMSPFEAASFDAVIDKGTLDAILCANNWRQNATKMLEEVWRVLKDDGVYIMITYGSPAHRLGLLKESCLWSIKLHVIAKFGSEGSSEQPIRDLTNPVPLEEGGSSVEDLLGNNPPVHYIYVCTKQEARATE